MTHFYDRTRNLKLTLTTWGWYDAILEFFGCKRLKRFKNKMLIRILKICLLSLDKKAIVKFVWARFRNSLLRNALNKAPVIHSLFNQPYHIKISYKNIEKMKIFLLFFIHINCSQKIDKDFWYVQEKYLFHNFFINNLKR